MKNVSWLNFKWLFKPFVSVCLLSISALAQAVEYKVIDLTPSGYDCEGLGVGGDQQVGFGYPGPTSGAQALLWSGSANSFVSLHPAGTVESAAVAADNGRQCGSASIFDPSGPGPDHAFLWSGSAASAIDLNPPGFYGSAAAGMRGGIEVGIGSGVKTNYYSHALAWKGSAASYIDLNPAGYTDSTASAIDSTGAIVGVGYQTSATAGGKPHALLWKGLSASEAVDLHPKGFDESDSYDVNNGRQVGYGLIHKDNGSFSYIQHALLWSGSADSVIDLHPAGFDLSVASGISNNLIVGTGVIDNGGHPLSHALLWSVGSQSYIDLQQFVPAGFINSDAASIDNQCNIIGSGVDKDGNIHALLWEPVPEPGSIAALALGLSALAYRRRRA